MYAHVFTQSPNLLMIQDSFVFMIMAVVTWQNFYTDWLISCSISSTLAAKFILPLNSALRIN